jgi:hypothetical protein
MNRVKEVRLKLFKITYNECKEKESNLEEYNIKDCLFKCEAIVDNDELNSSRLTKSRDLLKSFGRVEKKSSKDSYDLLYEEVMKNIETRRASETLTLMNTEYSFTDEDSVISSSSNDSWSILSNEEYSTDIDFRLIKCEEF